MKTKQNRIQRKREKDEESFCFYNREKNQKEIDKQIETEKKKKK